MAFGVFTFFFNINWKTRIICEAHEKHIFHLRGQHVWWGKKKKGKGALTCMYAIES